jgi:CheY-like chemotaxis protein
MLVLIVDDDEDDLELFQEALYAIDENIRSISAKDGEEALLLLNAAIDDKPDCIFSDLNMPRLDGKQFLVQLKNTAFLKHIPVTILTTSNLEDDNDSAIRLGAANFITKPSKFAGLIEAISKVILQIPKDNVKPR